MKRRDKAISPARKGRDECGVIGLVAQDLADPQYIFLNNLRIYVCIRPEILKNLFLCHKTVGMFNEVT